MPHSQPSIRITLPLGTLVEMLRQAGLRIGLDTELRLQELLRSLAATDEHPREWKGMLAPLIAKNEGEWLVFEQVYEQYMRYIETTPPPGEPEPQEPAPLQPRRWGWPAWTALAIGILALGWLLWWMFAPIQDPEPGKENTDTDPPPAGPVCLQKPGTHFEVRTETLRVGAPIELHNLTPLPDSTTAVSWDLGDGQVQRFTRPEEWKSPTLWHTYNREGTFNIRLTVVAGICDSTYVQQITVQSAFQPLPPEALREGSAAENNGAMIAYRWYFWLLLFGPPLAAIGLWEYYLRRYRPGRILTDPHLARRFAFGDDGPFTLHFPAHEETISGKENLKVLASMLRQRVQSDRHVPDLPRTIRQTIASGGFARLAFKATSRASEYVVLIDRSAGYNHLSRLFGFMASFLQKEEVPMEVYFYDADPRRVWNDRHPSGLDLGTLWQLHPHHFLLVFGRADRLLEPFSGELYDWAEPPFYLWKTRILLTPQPVGSWSYVEERLGRLFHVLPATPQGLLNILLARDLPEGDALQTQWHPEPLALSTWEAIADLPALEREVGPEAFRWVCACAAYPKVSWEMTLAIGRSLDVATLQNLYHLARLEWLRTGEYPDELRLGLLKALSPADEQAARQAIVALLAEVELTPQSFANREKEVLVATNEFLLQPDDPEKALPMYYIWQRRLLADRPVERRLAGEAEAQTDTAPALAPQIDRAAGVATLRGSLFRAAALLLLFLGLYYYAQRPATPAATPAWLTDQRSEGDSASLYNQLGVRYWQAQRSPAQPVRGGAGYQGPDTPPAADSAQWYFSQALRLRPDYAPALWNQAVLPYLAGKLLYEQESFARAVPYFAQAFHADSVRLQAAEALVKCFHYLGQADSARHYWNQLPDRLLANRIDTELGLGFATTDETSAAYASALAQADSLFARGLFAQARARYEQALSILPADPGGAAAKADLCNRELQWEERMARAEKAFIAENWAEALALYQQALDLFPDREAARLGIRKIEALPPDTRNQQQEKALAEVERLVENRQWEEARSRLTSLAAGNQQARELLADVEDLLESSSPTPIEGFEPQQSFRGLLKSGGQTTHVNAVLTLLSADGKNGASVQVRNTQTQRPLGTFRLQAGQQKMIEIGEQRYMLRVIRIPNRTKGPFREAVIYRLDLYSRQQPMQMQQAQQTQQTTSARTYTETVNGISFKMVYVEGGTFQMGDTFGEGDSDEKPVHEVRLDGYHIGETEVTQALWRAVMGNNPSRFSGCDECPVEQVSWNDIVNDFLPKLNRLTGKTYRLPTEAEWEYAARERGRKVRFGNGKDIADPKEINFNGSADAKQPYSVAGENRSKTTPVRSFASNALGLYDMSGNVWEWCSDWFGPYPSTAQTNPKGPSSFGTRVYRGGSWFNGSSSARIMNRSNGAQTLQNNDIGFRLVLSS